MTTSGWGVSSGTLDPRPPWGSFTANLYLLEPKAAPGEAGAPLLSRDGQVYGMVLTEAPSQWGRTPPGDNGFAMRSADFGAEAATGARATGTVGTGICGTD